MRVEIFDVGHGQCAVVTAPNGRRLMIDCGVKVRDGRFWWPSIHYYGECIQLVALTNLDEDHVQDFGGIAKDTDLGQVWMNPTIGPTQLRRLKLQGMGAGVKDVLSWLENPWTSIRTTSPDFGDVTVWGYYNPHVTDLTDTTNDLSLLIFVRYSIFQIVFAGDMETNGWRCMLSDPRVRMHLTGTSVFVASHHGRRNGCSADLFDILRPQVVIVSDEARKYDSQDTDDWYRAHCTGIPLAGGLGRRFVYTTRRDGSLKTDIAPDGMWYIQPVTVLDWPRKRKEAITPSFNPFLDPRPVSNPFSSILGRR